MTEQKEISSQKERLSIKLVGHDYVTAWKNTEKTSPNQPDYKGDGVAVWLHNKEKVSKTENVEEQRV